MQIQIRNDWTKNIDIKVLGIKKLLKANITAMTKEISTDICTHGTFLHVGYCFCQQLTLKLLHTSSVIINDFLF